MARLSLLLGPVGFEPTTNELWVRCSNRLSYGPRRFIRMPAPGTTPVQRRRSISTNKSICKPAWSHPRVPLRRQWREMKESRNWSAGCKSGPAEFDGTPWQDSGHQIGWCPEGTRWVRWRWNDQLFPTKYGPRGFPHTLHTAMNCRSWTGGYVCFLQNKRSSKSPEE